MALPMSIYSRTLFTFLLLLTVISVIILYWRMFVQRDFYIEDDLEEIILEEI